MAQNFPTHHESARSSSSTIINQHNVQFHDKGLGTPNSPLDEEIIHDELAFEKYGGDDIHEPPPKTRDYIARPSEAESDPDLVTWDGPDDPTNPQNWSNKYRWFLTVVCSVMTVNG